MFMLLVGLVLWVLLKLWLLVISVMVFLLFIVMWLKVLWML